MAEPLLVGLDVGTTSCKAGLFDARGNLIALASAPYGVNRLGAGRVEQDAGWYWDGAVRCLRQLLATPGLDPGRLAGMSACGQAPTMILLDSAGEPLGRRSCGRTRARRGGGGAGAGPGRRDARRLARDLVAGRRIHAHGASALAAQRAETLERTRLVLSPKDLVQLRLTGSVATDLWSARGMVHQGTRRPIGALRGADRAGPRRRAAGPGVRRGDGATQRAGRRATGLPEGLPVAAGWTDAMAAMLGSGGLDRAGAGGGRVRDVRGGGADAGRTAGGGRTAADGAGGGQRALAALRPDPVQRRLARLGDAGLCLPGHGDGGGAGRGGHGAARLRGRGLPALSGGRAGAALGPASAGGVRRTGQRPGASPPAAGGPGGGGLLGAAPPAHRRGARRHGSG